MVLLDKSPAQFPDAVADFGGRVEVGQLLTPLTRYRNVGRPFGIDNGAFSRFRAKDFRALLEREEENVNRCLFVAAPDVVGCANRTLDLLEVWAPRLQGWPIALVAQDGIEDLSVPWPTIRALFIGGTTEFKTSEAAHQLGREAKRRGKWLHVGRVNTRSRFDAWADFADSCDGTGISRYSHMRRAVATPDLFGAAS